MMNDICFIEFDITTWTLHVFGVFVCTDNRVKIFVDAGKASLVGKLVWVGEEEGPRVEGFIVEYSECSNWVTQVY